MNGPIRGAVQYVIPAKALRLKNPSLNADQLKSLLSDSATWVDNCAAMSCWGSSALVLSLFGSTFSKIVILYSLVVAIYGVSGARSYKSFIPWMMRRNPVVSHFMAYIFFILGVVAVGDISNRSLGLMTPPVWWRSGVVVIMVTILGIYQNLVTFTMDWMNLNKNAERLILAAFGTNMLLASLSLISTNRYFWLGTILRLYGCISLGYSIYYAQKLYRAYRKSAKALLEMDRMGMGL